MPSLREISARAFGNQQGGYIVTYSQSCPHCHTLFEQLGFQMTPGQITQQDNIVFVNIDQLPRSDQTTIRGVPDIKFYEAGRPTRAVSREELLQAINL